jgi:hypothetical protein
LGIIIGGLWGDGGWWNLKGGDQWKEGKSMDSDSLKLVGRIINEFDKIN